MNNAIAIIIAIVLTLALIATGVVKLVTGGNDLGDQAAKDQEKLKILLQDANTVTGNIVKSYNSRSDLTVTAFQSNGTTAITTIDSIHDTALFKMTKTFDENGQLTSIKFVQIDLSSSIENGIVLA